MAKSLIILKALQFIKITSNGPLVMIYQATHNSSISIKL